MKKVITMALAATLAATLFAGCGLLPYTCDVCGEMKMGKKYTQKILGEKYHYCKDCKDLFSLFD